MTAVTIIITTAGRPAALEATLRSLSTVAVPSGWLVDLILVENGSQTGAEALLRRLIRIDSLKIRYLHEPERGKSRALNLALSQAIGEILLFTDDDVRFPSNWIEGMCSPILSNRADAVAGGVRLAPHLLRPWMNRTLRAYLASTADYLDPQSPSEMCGANMAIHRRVFDRLGGFDVELGPGINGGGEESLLSWRLVRGGFRLAGAFDIEVEHHPDVARLLYESWLRVAENKGKVHAYQTHHWFQQSIAVPHLRACYLQLKLALRRLAAPRRRLTDEGIAPWELSYLEDHSLYLHFARERMRPRRYTADESKMPTFATLPAQR